MTGVGVLGCQQLEAGEGFLARPASGRWILASWVVARTGSGYRRTVGDEFFTGSGSTHVALDATARLRSGQTHVVKLADDALYELDTSEVGSAQSRHAQTRSIRDTAVGSCELPMNLHPGRTRAALVIRIGTERGLRWHTSVD